MAVKVNKNKCMSCGGCVGVCPVSALTLENGIEVKCDEQKCINCKSCVIFCPVGAISLV